jgi:glyoxylase-like metal-dependent hydrolase (beta-lactamase superfamily II)
MSRFLLLISLMLAVMAGSSGAETVEGLPLHVQKFDSGAIRVWVGDHISSTATVAIPTKKGLVIIDTTGNPKVDGQLRKVIARELGRDDFKILINTHEHGDHTQGNAVYADCTIVGHELVAEGMIKSPEDRQRTLDWLTNRISELEQEIGQLENAAPEMAPLQEQLIINRLQLEVARANEDPVVPTKTFSDRLDLDLGDTKFELYYIGGMHSASDIAILVPEHGLLMTGDTMADVWLTDTPGCLASFIARPGVRHDFPLLLANWNTLLDKKDEIETLVTGHWNGELTFEGFEARVKYIETLWEGTNQAAVANTGLEEMLNGFRLDTRFPDLASSPGCSQGNNSTTIVEMWTTVTSQESAALALYELIDQGASPSEIKQVVSQHGAKSPTHFFLEHQINGYGYRFFQQEKFEQAAALFKINVELFPESWNVYDSLGEALYAAGDHEKAIMLYEKSLELNPESPSGQQMLERIKSETAVN